MQRIIVGPGCLPDLFATLPHRRHRVADIVPAGPTDVAADFLSFASAQVGDPRFKISYRNLRPVELDEVDFLRSIGCAPISLIISRNATAGGWGSCLVIRAQW